MRFLFLHQNFPGQYRHLFDALGRSGQHVVLGMGQQQNVQRNCKGMALAERASIVGYPAPEGSGEKTHPYLRGYEAAIRQGQQWARTALELKKKGFSPDVVCVHPGWGEALFVREVFPRARVISFCEFYYRPSGADFAFDPEFPSPLDDYCALRIKNSALNQALIDCDLGIAPTEWQKSVHPSMFHDKIRVVHDGVDTQLLKPNPSAEFMLPSGLQLTRNEQVVTFVNRNLEPYRGVHVFMRALPELQRLCPDAHVVIVGGDGVSYGRRVQGGYRALLLKELEGQIDLAKVHFVGKLPYADYVRLLQVSSAHAYLTYPFVLSWSMLEAMALGCVIVGSATPPVQEVIVHGENGFLCDFFDVRALAGQIADVLQGRHYLEPIRIKARQTVVEQYDLRSVCLPQQIELLTG